MKSELVTKKLADVIELVIDNRGRNPKSYEERGIPIIDNYLIKSEGKAQLSEVKRFINEETYDSFLRKYIKEGDVLMTLVGNGYGKVATTPKEKCAIIQNTIGLRCNNQNYNQYLYYLFKNNRGALMNLNRGAAQPSIKVGDVLDLEFNFPSLSEQQRVAGILKAIDDKIETNTQTNQTLEQIAQAIFKSWFVDFDPVKAKIKTLASGGRAENAELAAMSAISAKTPDELHHLKTSNPDAFNKLAQTAALFPATMQGSELGEIPKGWKIKPIKDLCSKVQNGGTPKRSESSYWDGGDIPWLTSGEVRQSIITSVENRITQLGLEKSSAKWVSELSTLVALYGATAGEVSQTSMPLTTNQAVCALMPKKEYQWYNYLQLKSRVVELAGKAVGSAQQNISKGLVESTEVLSVSESLLGAFNAQVENLFKLRICNLQENVELANLRDTLLPKLLSGEIDLTSDDVE